VSTKGPGHIALKPSRFIDKALLLSLENDMDWLMWSAALCLHIAYADEVHNLRIERNRSKSLGGFSLAALNWSTKEHGTASPPAAVEGSKVTVDDNGLGSTGQKRDKQRRNTVASVGTHGISAPNTHTSARQLNDFVIAAAEHSSKQQDSPLETREERDHRHNSVRLNSSTRDDSSAVVSLLTALHSSSSASVTFAGGRSAP
jgi:hypothetical protein